MIDQYTDLIRIAKRENNKKRNYLVINRLQGKHIPVRPGEALGMFGQLADCLPQEYAGAKTLVIGFAETATAIGAAVAIKRETCYIQTTREEIEGVSYLSFSEEHSHAMHQRLVKQDLDRVMPKVDSVVFAEDEITTGKTIRNLTEALQREYPYQVKYAAVSVFNAMDQKALEQYHSRGIGLYYLIKTEQVDYTDRLRQYVRKGVSVNLMQNPYGHARTDLQNEIRIKGQVNARRLVEAGAYKTACMHLWQEIKRQLQDELTGSVLVLGTEEFMYPALYVADQIEKNGARVRFHATTRSPIEVYEEADYPLHVRYELPGLYEKDRRTFLYDIGNYDRVFIVTDACAGERVGTQALIRALVQAHAAENNKIYMVRWC